MSGLVFLGCGSAIACYHSTQMVFRGAIYSTPRIILNTMILTANIANF